METTLYVKKLVSLNPDKFKFFSYDYMLDKYSHYLFTINDHRKYTTAKNFRQWLATEI